MGKLKPRVGFCIVDNPLEVGSDQSDSILKKAVKELSGNELELLIYPKVVNNNLDMKKAGHFFYQEKADVMLVMQTTWSDDYHVTDLLEYIDVPVCLWAIPGMENGSLCGVFQLGVVLSEIDKKYEIFFGDINDKKIHAQIVSYCRAVGLKSYLRKQRIGLVGYRVPGMTEVTFDELELKRKFGPRLIHFGVNSIQKMSENIDGNEATKLWNDIKGSGIKIEVTENDGMSSCITYLALKQLSEEHGIKGFAVECYPGLMGQVCLAASLLARDGIAVACEGDVNSALAMMILIYLTGKPVHNTDILNPDSENSIVYSHCGSGDFSLARDKNDIKLCPVRLQDCGVCVTFLPKLGDITLVNIVGRKDTYRISAIEAYSQETKMVFPGNPVSARFNIPVDRYIDTVVKNAIGHHWVIGYGKVKQELGYFSQLVEVKFIDFK